MINVQEVFLIREYAEKSLTQVSVDGLKIIQFYYFLLIPS